MPDSEISTADVASPGTPTLRGTNQSGVRAHNERLLLSLLRRHGAMAKADIARATGLSAQTVSNITRALEAEGMIERRDPVRGKVGQPLVPLQLAATGAYFFGLKIGRRSTELVLTDFLGRIKARTHLTYRYPDPEATVRFARQSAAQLMGRLSPDEQSRIAGLGVAMPFRLWDWARKIGVDEDLMAAWRDIDIVQALAGDLDFPVYLENDASAACNAELVYGGPGGSGDFVYFYIGYFIGGGLALNGRLFTGQSGNAAALGSLPVPLAEGGTGQLIDVASLARLEELLESDGTSAAALWQPPATWSFDAARVDRWLDDAALAIAFAAIATTAVVDVSEARVDGWLPLDIRARLVERTTAHIGEFNLSGLTPPQVHEGRVGPDARVLGATSLPLARRFLLEEGPFLTTV